MARPLGPTVRARGGMRTNCPSVDIFILFVQNLNAWLFIQYLRRRVYSENVYDCILTSLTSREAVVLWAYVISRSINVTCSSNVALQTLSEIYSKEVVKVTTTLFVVCLPEL